MIKKKKSKSKDKPEANDNDVDLNSTIEDLEILEMTERTLVVSPDDDEETINLDEMEGEEFHELGADDAGEDALEVAPDSYVWEDESEDVDVATLNPEATILAPESAAPESPPAKSKSAKAEKQASKPGKKAASASKTAGDGNDDGKTADTGRTTNILIFILIPILAAVIGGGVVFFLQKPGGPASPSPEAVAPTVVQPVTKAVTRAEPEPAPEFETPPPEPAEPETTPQQPAPSPAPVVAEAEVAVEPETIPPVAANARAARTLRDIGFKEVGKTLQMKIVTDGVIKKYDSFPLAGPTRLVVDLFGTWDNPPFLQKDISTTDLVSGVRLGKHDDKLRIVVDFSRDKTINTAFTATSDGLIVAITTR